MAEVVERIQRPERSEGAGPESDHQGETELKPKRTSKPKAVKIQREIANLSSSLSTRRRCTKRLKFPKMLSSRKKARRGKRQRYSLGCGSLVGRHPRLF